MNLVVGKSCCRSGTWRARATRDLGGRLMWTWVLQPVCDVVSRGLRRKSRCRKDSSWGSQGPDLSSTSLDIPHLEALWWLEESRMTFVYLMTLNSETGLKWGGAMTLWEGFCAGLPKLIESLESTHPLDILCPFPVILTEKWRSLLWPVEVWGELTAWNEIWLGEAQLVSACVAVEIGS